MNVSLTPELEQYVANKLKSGSYASQSEVVREGLRLLMERDRTLEARLAQLRDDIAIGLEEARLGKLLDGDEVFDEIRRESRARREGRA